jgi:hypothetical protein
MQRSSQETLIAQLESVQSVRAQVIWPALTEKKEKEKFVVENNCFGSCCLIYLFVLLLICVRALSAELRIISR